MSQNVLIFPPLASLLSLAAAVNTIGGALGDLAARFVFPSFGNEKKNLLHEAKAVRPKNLESLRNKPNHSGRANKFLRGKNKNKNKHL